MPLSRLVFVALLALAGCATGYRPENANGGYSETQIDRNVFRVTFKGNIRVDQAQTNEMALLRSAEVTLANGFAWFVTSGNASTGSAVSLATNVVTIPATTITIVCFETRPETTGPVYDAREVVTRLGPKYLKD